MTDTIKMISSSLNTIKEDGSYLLFYLLSLCLGLLLFYYRDKSEKEEGREIMLWPFFYSVLGAVFVAVNPIAVTLLSYIKPIGGNYTKLWGSLWITFMIAYGIVLLMSLMKEPKQRAAIMAGVILLIGLSGNGYGYLAGRQAADEVEEYEAISLCLEEEAKGSVLAPDSIIEYLGANNKNIRLLYGKDLYTQGLDLGIMDAYDTELMSLYEAMKDPWENKEVIAETAFSYDCGAIVMTLGESAPKTMGKYRYHDTIGSYMIYIR